MENRFIIYCLNLSIILSLIFIIFSCSESPNKELEEVKSNISTEIKYSEIRAPIKSGINIRTGPGVEFDIDASGQIERSEKIYVLDEMNGWIMFRVTPNDIGWYGWVRKDLTILLSKSATAKGTNDIQSLKDSGLITLINPQLNQAFVDGILWSLLDFQTKEQAGRIMAFYCGREKGTNLNWVEIKDSKSGKKLAKYSESWGFKVY